MEWLKKILEDAQIKDGKLDVDSVIKSVNKEFPNYAVPKDEFNKVSNAKKQLEKDIKDRDDQIENIKKSAGDNEELKKEIENLQEENKTKDEEYKKQLQELSINTAIKLAVQDAKDIDTVAMLIDKSKLVVSDDGKVSGLDEQLTSLRKDKSFLFDENKNNKNDGDTDYNYNPAGGNKNTNSGATSFVDVIKENQSKR